jgi:zinc transport system substrate-binding protein
MGLFLAMVTTALEGAEVEPVRLLVTVPPYLELAERVGGPWVRAESLLQPGESHENFAPTPGRVARWQRMELYWGCGLDLETALRPRLQTVSPQLRWVATPSQGGATKDEAAEHSHAHDHANHDHDHAEHDHRDPHRWLVLSAVVEDTSRLAEALIALRPAAKAEIETNLATLKRECEAMEADFSRRFEPFSGARLYAYHGAWEQMAESLGLEMLALDEGGREPSLRQLTELIGLARKDGVTAVFVDPVHEGPAARKFADAIDARIISLDPLNPAWESSLREAVQRFEEELKARPRDLP